MNYPNGISKLYTNNINYGNRGMNLEEDLNVSNEYYLENDIAVIYKKPTPITINQVDYPNRRDAVITKAKFKTPSTTDYNGIYKGKYIDFEAKETANKTSFPLANIHAHQIEHLRRIVKHGGIGFIIVYFSSLNRLFLLMANDLFSYLDNNERKSIPLSFFEEKAKEMKVTLRPRIDYLKYIEF